MTPQIFLLSDFSCQAKLERLTTAMEKELIALGKKELKQLLPC